MATTSPVAPGTITLPHLEPVSGEAPARLADSEGPVVYLTYSADFDELEAPAPPAALGVELLGCTLAGPGVVVYDISLSGGEVSYPFETIVLALIYAGDMGTGTAGLATFAAPGRQLLVSSFPDQLRPYEAAGGSNFRQGVGSSRADREPEWARSGMGCEIEFGSDYEVRSNYTDLVAKPESITVTAPADTVEALAQAAYAVGEDAPLAPLAIAYGEGLRFYAERWFVPEDPTPLLHIEESLSNDGCLQVEFAYQSYSVLQQLRCSHIETEAVYQAGNRWFARASDGEWEVSVTADDPDTARSVASSLIPYWHLFHRAVPLAPADEKEIGRASYQGGEVLVTFGEQRCSGSCRSPESWFFVYRNVDGALEEFAHYPGWDGCLLVEEDEFVLAVAPRRGSISIRAPGDTFVVTDDEEKPFFFRDTADGPVTVEMTDEDGAAPRCVALLATDGRGGIEPFPGSDTQDTEPSAQRTITATECAARPVYLDQYTDEDPIRMACAETDFGRVSLVLVKPNEILAEPPAGQVCLVEMFENGAGASCGTENTGITEPIRTGYDEFWSISMTVPEGTTRVKAATSRGTELIGIPHEGLVLLWWLPAEGELLEATAETGDGPVTLYVRG